MSQKVSFFEGVCVKEFGIHSDVFKKVVELGIPINNFHAAYAIDHDIVKSFDGTNRGLKGDGNNYIEIGITKKDMRFKLMFEIKASSNLNCSYLGTLPNYSGIYNWGNRLFCGGSSNFGAVTSREFAEISVIGTNCFFEGKESTLQWSTNQPLYLYKVGGVTTGNGKIYKYISDNMYLIPIRLTDGTCTMYDLIANKALEPQGEGSFTIE